MLRLGITSFAFPSLSTANPEEFPVLCAKLAGDIEKRKTSGNLPPGLAEQLDLQLAALKNETIPDLEFVGFPGLYSAHCERFVTLSSIVVT